MSRFEEFRHWILIDVKISLALFGIIAITGCVVMLGIGFTFEEAITAPCRCAGYVTLPVFAAMIPPAFGSQKNSGTFANGLLVGIGTWLLVALPLYFLLSGSGVMGGALRQILCAAGGAFPALVVGTIAGCATGRSGYYYPYPFWLDDMYCNHDCRHHDDGGFHDGEC